MSDLIALTLPSDEPDRRPEVTSVPFLDGAIPCVVMNGEPMVILRPVSDLLGLNWASQYTKISADQAARVVFSTTRVPGDDRPRRHMTVTLETFAVWLARLQPSRVAREARDTVLTYQREAGRALRDHFFGRPAEPARKPSSGIALLEEMVGELRAQHERTTALEVKVEAIEGRHDWFTALAHAKLTDRPTDRPYLSKVGAKATRLMKARGDKPVPRQDATFGLINTYPSDVLEQAFEAVTR